MKTQYTPQELLEMAALDVLGLLDTDEREAFERGFRAAAPSLQAEIRREQLRLVGMEESLPKVDVPLGLRARVMAAIREAMQSAMPRREVAGRIVPEIAPARSVSRWWRAGAIGAAAAALVFAFTTLQMRSDYVQLVEAEQGNQMRDFFLREFGHRFEQTFFNENTRFVQFASASDSRFAGKAILVLDPETKKGQLYLKDLPAEAGQYALVIVNERGQVADAVLNFTSTGAGGVERRDVASLDIDKIPGLAIIQTRGDQQSTLLRSKL